jgi:catechol 2,3-dioxygenase-like lactoylglutathione lyase family enzyme
MFTPSGAFSGFSIDDADAAKEFYGETLGLRVTQLENGFLNLHLESGAVVLAYVKENHEPASFTILNFEVDDVDAAVDDLNARGVDTNIYGSDIPADHRGVMKGNGPDIAWFRDPAGNVLSVLSAS